MYIPGYTYHLVQRGNNREACFFETENYRVYLKYMQEVLSRYCNQLHAYRLMTFTYWLHQNEKTVFPICSKWSAVDTVITSIKSIRELEHFGKVDTKQVL